MPTKEHKLRTPPWKKLHSDMVARSATLRWEDKIPLAMHTGNVGSHFRKQLARVAEQHPKEVLVNEPLLVVARVEVSRPPAARARSALDGRLDTARGGDVAVRRGQACASLSATRCT